MNNIGVAFYYQNKYREAEVMYRRAMKGREKTLGPEHTDTLTSTNSVGAALKDEQKYAEAEVMYRRAMEGREKTLVVRRVQNIVFFNIFLAFYFINTVI
jgi:Tfp pilus assembly protein PilF